MGFEPRLLCQFRKHILTCLLLANKDIKELCIYDLIFICFFSAFRGKDTVNNIKPPDATLKFSHKPTLSIPPFLSMSSNQRSFLCPGQALQRKYLKCLCRNPVSPKDKNSESQDTNQCCPRATVCRGLIHTAWDKMSFF